MVILSPVSSGLELGRIRVFRAVRVFHVQCFKKLLSLTMKQDHFHHDIAE
jgi:hypothetical protein